MVSIFVISISDARVVETLQPYSAGLVNPGVSTLSLAAHPAPNGSDSDDSQVRDQAYAEPGVSSWFYRDTDPIP